MRLSKISALKVISRTSCMQLKGTKKPLRDIAHALGVDGIVEGSVLRSGDRVRITAQLIAASTDAHLWAESYERDLKDILALQGEVAVTIAGAVSAALTPQAAPGGVTTRSEVTSTARGGSLPSPERPPAPCSSDRQSVSRPRGRPRSRRV